VLKKLPVIFILENNQFSVCSRVSSRQAGRSIFHATSDKLMSTAIVDGNSVLDVYNSAQVAVERARSGEGPSFIECITYRVRGHAGAGMDAHLGYRTYEEIKEWEVKCPLETFKKTLLKDKLATENDFAEMEKKIDDEIDEAFRFAQASHFPKSNHVLQYLFSE